MDLYEEYVQKGYWGNLVLGDLLDHSVRDYPEKIAMVQGERRITYKQFGSMVNRLAFKLLELGVGKGDFVAIVVPNCIEYAYFEFAVAKIGAVSIPMVHTQQIREVGYAVNLFNPPLLVVSSGYTKLDFIDMAQQLRQQYPCVKNVIVVREPASKPSYPPGMTSFDQLMSKPAPNEDDPEMLRKFRPKGTDLLRVTLSAGTTGAPKAAMRTHNDSLASLRWDAVWHDWGENVLLFFPLGHSTGHFVGLDLQVLLGRQITLMMGKFDAESVLSLIEKENVTAVYLPTPLFTTIAEALEKRPQLALAYNLKSLTKFVFGGAQAASTMIHTMIESTGRPVLQTWGMAEGAVTSTLITDPPYVQAYTIGQIQCPDAKIKVVDEDGKDVPAGTPGELMYKGPFLFAGYYKDPELTKKSIDAEGYFHTGDQVILDRYGNIKIVGRLKDLIRRGGEPISAVEVEDIIARHEKVAEVAVVAMPDKRMIEKVCAYVVPKPNATITFDEIIAFMKTKGIATFKLPERIELIDRLPRGEQKGNVLKARLREDVTNKLKAEGQI